jgi:hypothetical protein
MYTYTQREREKERKREREKEREKEMSHLLLSNSRSKTLIVTKESGPKNLNHFISTENKSFFCRQNLRKLILITVKLCFNEQLGTGHIYSL